MPTAPEVTAHGVGVGVGVGCVFLGLWMQAAPGRVVHCHFLVVDAGRKEKRSKPVLASVVPRSNKKLIHNAIKFSCLAGAINATQRKEVLAIIEACPAHKFIILLRKRR